MAFGSSKLFLPDWSGLACGLISSAHSLAQVALLAVAPTRLYRDDRGLRFSRPCGLASVFRAFDPEADSPLPRTRRPGVSLRVQLPTSSPRRTFGAEQ